MFIASSRAGRRRRPLTTVLVAVALTLCFCDAFAAAAAEGPHMNPVAQCREDFNAICAESASARELWGCMMKNVDTIANAICRSYVMGFRACTLDAEKKGSCVHPAADYATSVRRCLRSMDEAKISQECLNSRFYLPIAESRDVKY